VVECLFYKHNTLSSNTNPHPKKKKKKSPRIPFLIGDHVMKEHRILGKRQLEMLDLGSVSIKNPQRCEDYLR
jgi:hypothetical protein